MALEGLGTDDFTGPRFLETLCGGAVCLYFGHYEHPPFRTIWGSEFAIRNIETIGDPVPGPFCMEIEAG